MPQDARAAARAAIAALSRSPRPGGTEAETIERCAKVVDAPGPLEGYEHLEQNSRAMIRAIRDQLAAAIRALTPQTTGEKDKP
jgi:hypothetical protein